MPREANNLRSIWLVITEPFMKVAKENSRPWNDVRSWTNYWQPPPTKGGESKWCRTIENHSTFPVCCNKLSLPLWIRWSSKPGQSQACRFLGSCYEKSDKRHTKHNPQTKQDHGLKSNILRIGDCVWLWILWSYKWWNIFTDCLRGRGQLL